MSIGPTSEALLRRKRASKGRPREEDDRPGVTTDTAAFEVVATVCLGGVVGLAVIAELAGLGR